MGGAVKGIGLTGFRRRRQRLSLDSSALLASVAAAGPPDFVLAGIRGDLAGPEIFGHALDLSTL